MIGGRGTASLRRPAPGLAGRGPRVPKPGPSMVPAALHLGDHPARDDALVYQLLAVADGQLRKLGGGVVLVAQHARHVGHQDQLLRLERGRNLRGGGGGWGVVGVPGRRAVGPAQATSTARPAEVLPATEPELCGASAALLPAPVRPVQATGQVARRSEPKGDTLRTSPAAVSALTLRPWPFPSDATEATTGM